MNGSPTGGLLKIVLGALLGFGLISGQLSRLVAQAIAALSGSASTAAASTVSPGTSSGSTQA